MTPAVKVQQPEAAESNQNCDHIDHRALGKVARVSQQQVKCRTNTVQTLSEDNSSQALDTRQRCPNIRQQFRWVFIEIERAECLEKHRHKLYPRVSTGKAVAKNKVVPNT